MQCAQCHDHKFDPIAQEDYYALQAVFAALDRVDREYDYDSDVAREREALKAELTKFAREKDFLGGVSEWREASIHHVAVGEDTTMTEWHLDFVHDVYGHKKGNHVAVQQWKDGKVVREQFYSIY